MNRFSPLLYFVYYCACPSFPFNLNEGACPIFVEVMPIYAYEFTMYELNAICFQGVSMAPLWDFCRSQFVGVLSAMDFILILKEVCGE